MGGEHRPEHGSRAGSLERWRAGRASVEDASEAEQVAPGVDREPLGLLGGHVGRRAEDGPGRGQVLEVALGPGEAEVEDPDPAPGGFEPDVGRLDVAVDQPARVGRRQPLGDLAADPERLVDRRSALATEPGVERLPLEQGHGDEGDPAVLTDVVDGDDVVVIQGRDRLGLAEEPEPVRGDRRQGRPHRLERDRPPELGVLRVEDDPHPARAEHSQDAIGAEPADLPRRPRRGEGLDQLRGLRVDRGPRPGAADRLGRGDVGDRRRVLGGPDLGLRPLPNLRRSPASDSVAGLGRRASPGRAGSVMMRVPGKPTRPRYRREDARGRLLQDKQSARRSRQIRQRPHGNSWLFQ